MEKERMLMKIFALIFALLLSACVPPPPRYDGPPIVGGGSPQTALQQSQNWVSDQIASGKVSTAIGDPNCMVPAIPSIASNGQAVTLVHPRIVQFSGHYAIGVNSVFTFGDQSYTVIKVVTYPLSVSPWLQPDIAFGLLDRPVPDVKPMRIILAPTAELNNLPAFWYVARHNRIVLLKIDNFNFPSMGSKLGKAVTVSPPTLRIGTDLIGGDSGSPLISRIDSEFVMTCTAYSARAGSGIANYLDLIYATWSKEFGIKDTYKVVSLKPGDTNDDNKVTFEDYITLSNNYMQTTEYGHNVGDFNRDGLVDFEDYTILANNFGK
jgi:hypothetical protein